ncbi:MAG: hypothetical protein ACFE96_18500 [Candidatus Hermodarchaeota archaeon]
MVRFEAAKILIQNYPNQESKSLLWALQNENSIFFFKALTDLLESYDSSQLDEIREKVLNKIRMHYNLKSDDSKFILDIDYLDYMKFKNEFENFLDKFDFPDDEKLQLLKENTQLGNKGLGRVRLSKEGYIISLLLKDIVEIPKSICNLKKLETLEISHCTLKSFPEKCPNLLSLKKLIFNNNKVEKLPSWVANFANKHKFVDRYINDGVKRSEAKVLGIFEILSGHNCFKLSKFDENEPKSVVKYEINSLGYITKIHYSSIERRIGVFPQELCELEFLEELTLKNQNIRAIPETIGELNRLRVLDLSNNPIDKIPESINNLKNLVQFYIHSEIQNN